MLFADDTAVAARIPLHLKSLMDCFTIAYIFRTRYQPKKKTKLLQATISLNITINNYQLKIADEVAICILTNI